MYEPSDRQICLELGELTRKFLKFSIALPLFFVVILVIILSILPIILIYFMILISMTTMRWAFCDSVGYTWTECFKFIRRNVRKDIRYAFSDKISKQ